MDDSNCINWTIYPKRIEGGVRRLRVDAVESPVLRSMSRQETAVAQTATTNL
ncbi:hypothetical protein RMSM_06687 [Rhodopirellula maiorica SM1]|uniref:Uncharacterized protein n=1 Tax=Rhodopirellula maiorica SM1 TaxID=1265738 RepID=M5RAI9_9BACT|nr:hypothetical protein RMSM_06687 [Rhodopirellula maiorica SM1]